MMSARSWILSAAACSLCWACGARPEPPGRADVSQDAEEAVTALESADPQGPEATADEPATSPEPPPVARPEPEPPTDAGEAPEPGADGDGLVFAACLEDGGDCSVINIAVIDLAAESCIELAVDDCGTFSRAGLPVDTPPTWRLGSASVGELPEGGCIPGAYDSDSAIVVDGSGSIRWNLDTRRPSDVVVDVALETASAAGAPAVGIVGTVAGAVPDCDD
jgi:hypothetical protein